MTIENNRFEKLFRSIFRKYASFSTWAWSILLLLIAFNLLIAMVNSILDPNPIVAKYGMEKLATAYPDMNSSEIEHLLKETWQDTKLVYEGYVQFKEETQSGKYLNISKEGFRQNGTPKKLVLEQEFFNIFLFGGSTTFGYGVGDDQTIAHHLESSLNGIRKTRVFNFARGSYFSSQERILFEQLLENHTPEMVIFIDGLNDFGRPDGQPEYSNYIRETLQFSFYVAQKRFFRQLPMIDFIRGVRDSFKSQPNSVAVVDTKAAETEARKVLKRYFFNKDMVETICAAKGILPMFVWQPIPSYPQKHPNHFLKEQLPPWQGMNIGYSIMKDQSNKVPNFMWAADFGHNIETPYVDIVHYSKDMNSLLAEKVAEAIVAKW